MNESTGSHRIFHCLEKKKKGSLVLDSMIRTVSLQSAAAQRSSRWSRGQQIIGRWFVNSGRRILVKGRRPRCEKSDGRRWEIRSVSPSDCPTQAALNYPKFIFHSVAVWFVRPRWPCWFGKVDSFAAFYAATSTPRAARPTSHLDRHVFIGANHVFFSFFYLTDVLWNQLNFHLWCDVWLQR